MNLLETSEITLLLIKCHFVYSNITALDHHIFKLRFNTMKKKVKTIRQMIFSRNLRELKTSLDFFGYYRKFVKDYAIIIRLLIQLKIESFKKNSNKNKSRRNHAKKKRFSINSNSIIIIAIKIKLSSFNSIKFIFKFIKLKTESKCYEI